jgi:hypothetical protein
MAALIASATLAVELGAYGLACAMAVSPRNAVLTMFAASAVWTALAAPMAAAGGRKWLAGVVRGGTVTDTTALALLIVTLTAQPLTFMAALKVYCILTAFALAAMTIVRCGRTPAGRRALATICSVLLMAALTTSFWANGVLAELTGNARQLAATWLVAANPFFAIASATANQLHFIWHEAPVMYRITGLGDYAAPAPVAWYAAPLAYLSVAALACIAAVVRSRDGKAPRIVNH